MGDAIGPHKITLVHRYRKPKGLGQYRAMGTFLCQECGAEYDARIDKVIQGKNYTCGCIHQEKTRVHSKRIDSFEEGDRVGPYGVELVGKATLARGRVVGLFECPVCGENFADKVQVVLYGDRPNCGCKPVTLKFNREPISAFNKAEVKTLKSRWRTMMSRCYKPTHKSYANYGGRGIEVDPRWHTFDNYLEDILDHMQNQGLRFKDLGQGRSKFTLDRMDNMGDYSKENTRFATTKQQANNRRSSLFNTLNG